jgi:small-conductance mechanosensitive channel
LETPKFKLADIFSGIIIPLILVLLIYVLAVYVNPSGTNHVLGVSGTGGTVAVILSQGFAQMIILGIPLVLGLLWNKWAGGAAGFIMGGMYYIAQAGLYTGYYAGSNPPYNFFGDVSLLFWLVNGVIIGYIAGSLNNGSTNFKRMLGAGLTAAITTAIIQAYLNYTISLAPSRGMAQGLWATDLTQAILINFVPNIALGVIVPILGKVMTWYGLQPMRH